MNQIEKNKLKTDQAWVQLYTRLEQDGLLDKPTSGTQIPYRIGLMKWVAAIIILCVSVATAIFLGQERTPEAALLTLHNNEASTTLVTTLEDGSIVYLADNSQLSYPEHFQREKREVSLLGNALFDVSGNKERPFLIETEQARIEVLGTSFNIKSSDKSIFELAVRRGLVKVTLKKNGEQTLVKAGQTVSLFSNRLQVAPTQDNEQFSDYTRRIQFKDERLGDILHVINLEYPMMPLKATADLEDRRLTVSFYNNSPATMAELICAALKLKCTQQNNIWMISEP
ncbi:FecR family protein [Parabacteroides distasonis]|uniref:Anti-sigma factor n=1 Tax=Parabacteroides distasonis TaxID=823 RepID=A0A3L7ZRY8_PARDI|nr:FecR domain-containing protein [Parabacteroides distasonis]NBH88612.1 anti-sigma factor [Parabacteroides distasonis]RLT74051.1 anti-sigma factor [Parabacteroides distasonis]TGY62346.1 anti-sigma factor [Parabacteroides distasonis]